MSSKRKNKKNLPIVLDCEASGLGKDSYPIEVGIAFDDGSVESFLIKPHHDWTFWDLDAEKIHNIKREELESGYSLYEAASFLNSQLRGCMVYSDCVEYEIFWIDRIFKELNIFRAFEIESLFAIDDFDHQRFTSEKNSLYSKTIRHRAGNDAKVLQTAYKNSAY